MEHISVSEAMDAAQQKTKRNKEHLGGISSHSLHIMCLQELALRADNLS